MYLYQFNTVTGGGGEMPNAVLPGRIGLWPVGTAELAVGLADGELAATLFAVA